MDSSQYRVLYSRRSNETVYFNHIVFNMVCIISNTGFNGMYSLRLFGCLINALLMKLPVLNLLVTFFPFDHVSPHGGNIQSNSTYNPKFIFNCAFISVSYTFLQCIANKSFNFASCIGPLWGTLMISARPLRIILLTIINDSLDFER